MKEVDLEIGLRQETLGMGREFTLAFHKPDVPGQTFGTLTVPGNALGKLLAGEKIPVRFQMWEEPR